MCCLQLPGPSSPGDVFVAAHKGSWGPKLGLILLADSISIVTKVSLFSLTFTEQTNGLLRERPTNTPGQAQQSGEPSGPHSQARGSEVTTPLQA